MGFFTRNKKRKSQERMEYTLPDEEILKMYETKSATVIAKELEMSPNQVSNVILRNRVEKRNPTYEEKLEIGLAYIKPLPKVGDTVKVGGITAKVLEVYDHIFVVKHPTGYRESFMAIDNYLIIKS